MTRRMFLVEPAAWAGAGEGDTVEVAGPEGRHAVAVVRVRPGETVLLSDGAGSRAEAVVVSVDRQSFAARLGAVTHTPGRVPRFVLVQALAKGDRDEQAVETATELGVDEVVPWQAARSVAQWRGEKTEKGRQRWLAIATAAAKQSRRADVPVVAPLASSGDVARRVERAACALVLHEEATVPLASVELPSSGDVVVVVGPEGGLTDDEVASLTTAGGYAVRLGPEVLRTSSAGPAALAVLSAMARWR